MPSSKFTCDLPSGDPNPVCVQSRYLKNTALLLDAAASYSDHHLLPLWALV